MKTISLPVTLSEEDKELVLKLQKQQNSVIRYAYNRIKEGKSQTEIEAGVDQLKNVELIDTWYERCAIYKAKGMVEAESELNKVREKNEQSLVEKAIFGGKHNFYRRLRGKISNEQWKEERLMPLYIIGEIHHGGNRKFNIDMVNNKIIYKPYGKKRKIIIDLPKLTKNWLDDLTSIQGAYTVHLTTTSINITFAEQVVEQKPVKDRVLGIDINPNYIGFTVCDIKDGVKQEPLFRRTYSLIKITDANKKKHELMQICHQIIRVAKHYKCSIVAMEELSMGGDSGKGRSYNKMVNNDWHRSLVVRKMKMLSLKFGIDFRQINPAYTSVIGNMMYGFPDPESASIEIARRACFKFQKGKFYPEVGLVKDLWKKYLTTDTSWKDLHQEAKTRDLRVRVPLPDSPSGFGFSKSSRILVY